MRGPRVRGGRLNGRGGSARGVRSRGNERGGSGRGESRRGHGVEKDTEEFKFEPVAGPSSRYCNILQKMI